MMKANKQIGFININEESIDKILKDGEVVFEKGFLREKTSTTLPITFGGVGKDLKDYKAYGNTYQNSTSGKNKYGITSAKGYSYSSSLPNVPNQNMIIDFYDLNNIEFHVESNSYLIALLPTIQLQANTDYILSYVRINNIISGNPRRYIYAVDENENYSLINSVTNGDAGNISHQFTTSSSGKIALAFGYSNNSKGNSSIINNLMVRLATDTDNTFEPYTGGQSSPNPNYPQKIISCGDRTKNLFDKDNANTLDAYISNTLVSSATSKTLYIPCKPNTTYVISRQLVGKRFQAGTTEITPVIDTPVNDITPQSYENQNSSITLTTGSNAQYLVVFYSNIGGGESLPNNNGYTEEELRNSIQIEEGSAATSYEPYGYKIPVNVRSDNLLKSPESIPNSQRNLATYTKINDNSFSLNYTQNDSYSRSPYVRIDFDVTKLKPNTKYTISKKNIISGDTFSHSGALRTYINGVNGNTSDTDSLTFTTPSQIDSLGIYFYLGFLNTTPGESTVTFNEIQLVEGSTAPSKYIPYYNETTNIYLDEPLRKIVGYSDHIDFINGKFVRNIKELILDGSEDFIYGYSQGLTNTIRIDLRNVLINSNAVSENKIICDKFISAYGDIADYEHCRNFSSSYPDTLSININKSRLSDISTHDKLMQSLRAWLSSNNITLDYVLATPTEESITLPNIPTINGNNTLNIETEITPSQVYIKYKSNE